MKKYKLSFRLTIIFSWFLLFILSAGLDCNKDITGPAGPQYVSSIVFSSDNGVTWVTYDVPGYEFLEDITDLNTPAFTSIIALARTGGTTYILRSIDGGDNFTRINYPLQDSLWLRSISRTSVQGRGFISANKVMLKTIDDGITWNIVNIDTSLTGIYDLSDIDFLDGQDIGIAAGTGTILHTFDNGETWIKKVTGDINIWISKIKMLTPSIAVCIGEQFVSGVIRHYIGRSSDGGINWVFSELPFGAILKDISFLNSTVIISTGYYETGPRGLYISTDMGLNYTLQSVQSDESLPAIICTPSLFITGGIGLYKSTDFGHSWSVSKPRDTGYPSSSIFKLYSPAAEHFFGVGTSKKY